MAITKGLIGKVATRKNLEAAWRDVNRLARPQSHGMSEQTIQDFRLNYKNYLEEIRKQLLEGKYSFGPPRGVTIEKKGGKKRPLKIFDIRDRVVQRAIARVLETYLSKPFRLNNRASHAYIHKKSVNTAISQMLKYHQQGFHIILEADIIDFFGTVNREKLLNEMIFPCLPDTSINRLIKGAFEMEIGNKNSLPDEDWRLYPEGAPGLPQGGYLSPLFSNIYLSEFDQAMLKNKSFRLIRYADDFIIMCKSFEDIENAYGMACAILEGSLGLHLHERNDNDKEARTRAVRISQSKIKFLGIQFNGTRIWPDSEKKKKLSEKLKERCADAKNVRELLNSIKNLLEGWIAAYGFTDIDDNYLNRIDSEINKLLWIALKKFGWKLKSITLDTKQRESSGIGLARNFKNKLRSRMPTLDRDLFSAYWLIEK